MTTPERFAKARKRLKQMDFQQLMMFHRPIRAVFPTTPERFCTAMKRSLRGSST